MSAAVATIIFTKMKTLMLTSRILSLARKGNAIRYVYLSIVSPSPFGKTDSKNPVSKKDHVIFECYHSIRLKI